ncbi:hypothetical protein ACFE04_002956 [Oxalis oulophora]
MSPDLELRNKLSPLIPIVKIDQNRISQQMRLSLPLKIVDSIQTNRDQDENNDLHRDLQLGKNFTQIRLSSSSSSSPAAASTANVNSSNGGEEVDGYRTPTAAEHKIPIIQICPPTPRKPRRSTIPCKRKLEFFEIRNHEQIDDFFRTNYDLVFKRRCSHDLYEI